MKKKRKKIRIISFLSAVIITLSTFSAVSFNKIKNLNTQLSIWEQSSLCSLSSYIDTIKTDLYKGLYAVTPTMTGKISSSLMQSSAAALECLQRLPTGEKGLSNIYKFLTQVGNFTSSLNTKVSNNKNITDTEYKNMQKLFKYAADLSSQIDYIQEVMLSGNINFDKQYTTLAFKKAPNDLSLSYTDTIQSAEESFTDFPSLIYDGPFSDDILNKESVLLQKKEEISRNKAQKICADYLSVNPGELSFKYEEKSNLNAYVFSVINSGKQTIAAVTKKGGYLSYILSDSYGSESKYNESEAVNQGLNFLKKAGYENMKSTYYSVNDGICTVNYGYEENGYICYPDLIKVSINLSNCTVTGFDARTFLLNHKERNYPENIISTEDALKNVSRNLTVTAVKNTVIPTDSTEKYAYEFKCTGTDGDDVLVYIDMFSGQEDEILILLHGDGGILTK